MLCQAETTLIKPLSPCGRGVGERGSAWPKEAPGGVTLSPTPPPSKGEGLYWRKVDLRTLAPHLPPMPDATRAWAEAALGHRFQDPTLIDRALTHPSTGDADYQRLEFLGDRVLGLAIAEWLYAEFEDAEGALTRRLVELVSGEINAEVARAMGADGHVRLGRQARADGVKHSDNVLGDVCEALIGALWLDGGWEPVRSFVRKGWAPHMATRIEPPKHPKSELQEWANGRGLPTPLYEVIGRKGPHHAPCFCVRVTVKGHEPAEADGGNKQEAERAAAAAMLKRLGA